MCPCSSSCWLVDRITLAYCTWNWHCVQSASANIEWRLGDVTAHYYCQGPAQALSESKWASVPQCFLPRGWLKWRGIIERGLCCYNRVTVYRCSQSQLHRGPSLQSFNGHFCQGHPSWAVGGAHGQYGCWVCHNGDGNSLGTDWLCVENGVRKPCCRI